MIKAILIDIGGVLLTKGWDRVARKKAAEHFGLDYDEMRERHDLVFHLYEEGRMTLDDYLTRVVFYREREFSSAEFTRFIFEQSQPLPEMLRFISDLKAEYNIKMVALSNEGREITDYRIYTFNLASLIDFFVCSCYVGLRKPDPAIYHLAMDELQLPREEVVYIDDSIIHAEVARELGIPTIHHTGYDTTRSALSQMGLTFHPGL